MRKSGTKKFRLKRVIITGILSSILVLSIQSALVNYNVKQQKARSKQAVIQPVKVFQIGFSKCGTTTISNFFNSNGVPSVHHDHGRLPASIHRNYINGEPLLDKRYKQILVFTDLDLLYREPLVQVGMQYFKELDQQYPGSKFILNTRNKEAWLKSRAKQPIAPKNESLLTISARLHKVSEEEMLQQWSKEWDMHHSNVLEYFKDRPDDLLVFNIETDGPAKLVEFFKHEFKLSTKYYTQKNSTAWRSVRRLWDKYLNFDKPVVFFKAEGKVEDLK